MNLIKYVLIFKLNAWFEELKQELQSCEIADTIEGSHELIIQFEQQREATVNASINTIREGEHLLEQLRYLKTFNCLTITDYNYFSIVN